MTSKVKTVKLPGLHPAQRRIVAEAKRNNVLCCGRRFGKTTLAHNLVVEAVAKGLPVGWFSPSYKSLSESWTTLNHLLDPIITDRSAQEKTLKFSTGGKLDMWSLHQSGAAARGRAYALAVVDEAAQVVGLEEAWQNVIRPMLVAYRGNCWFLSTPSGSQHYFYKLFLRGMDPDQRDTWMAWQFPHGGESAHSAG